MRSWSVKALVTLLAGIALALLATTRPAFAQTDEGAWTGTWMSNHGEMRLIQEGERVYGDFAQRGIIEARVQQDGRLRGTFQNPDSGIRDGYFEFTLNDETFTGGWGWPDNGKFQAGANNWSGLQLDNAPPRLQIAARSTANWADFWSGTSAEDRAWIEGSSGAGSGAGVGISGGGGVGYAEPDDFSEEWTGTFQTNFGELRLTQIGRRVYGDYANRGYFEGCAHGDGTILRGTFQYNSPRNYHGFAEFRTDGDGFAGTWTWTARGVPQPDAAIGWRGVRVSAPAPSLIYVDGASPHFADNWPDITDAQRQWVLGSDYYDSCDPPDIDYDQ